MGRLFITKWGIFGEGGGKSRDWEREKEFCIVYTEL